MPAYDPAARRPPAVVDHDAGAPVDALIDLRVEEPPVVLAAGATGPDAPALPRTSPPLVLPASAPESITRKLAIIGGVALAAVAIVVVLARRRRR